MIMTIQDCELRSGDQPLKRHLPGPVPVVTKPAYGLEPRTQLSIPVSSIVMHDLDGKDGPELILGDRETPNVLRFYRRRAGSFEYQELVTYQVDEDVAQPLIPLGVVGDRLAVHCAQRSRAAAEGNDYRGDVRLLTLGPTGLAEPAELQVEGLPNVEGVWIAAVDYGTRGRGFVVAKKEHARAFELYEFDRRDGPRSWTSRGLYSPHKLTHYAQAGAHGRPPPRPRDRSDILSAVAFDWDKDGSDDLFLGLGPLDGFGPALVMLDGTNPTAALKMNEERWGNTRVSICNLPFRGQPEPHLVAASQREWIAEGTQSTQHGLRVWRLEDLRKDWRSPPRFHVTPDTPPNVTALATGPFNGRDVIATTVVTPSDVPPGKNTVLRMYEVVADQLTVVWEATFFDAPEELTCENLLLTDLDADGQTELLAVSRGHGILIFAAEPDLGMSGP